MLHQQTFFIYTSTNCPSRNKFVLNEEPNQIISSINYYLFIQILELNNKVYCIEEWTIVIYRSNNGGLKNVVAAEQNLLF